MQSPQGCPLGYLEGTSHLVRLTDKVDRVLEHGFCTLLRRSCAKAAQRKVVFHQIHLSVYGEVLRAQGREYENERYLISAAVYARPLP